MPIILDPIWQPPGPLGTTGTSCAQLLQELGERMGDHAAGMVSADSTDTTYLDDNTRVEPDNVFAFGWLTYTGVHAAANTGQERRITWYDGSLNVGRFGLGNGNAGSGLPTPALTGDTYDVHLRWSRRRKLAAINRAIRRLPQGFWRRIEDASMTTQPNTWSYVLPQGMTQVWKVEVQTNLQQASYPYMAIQGWEARTSVAVDGSIVHTLQLRDVPPYNRLLRLTGAGIQLVLANDSDTIGVGQDDYDQRLVEYLLTYAQAYLWLEGADGAPIDQAARSTEMVKLQLQIAAEMKSDLIMPNAPLEVDSPATGPKRSQGDAAANFAAYHTPGPNG